MHGLLRCTIAEFCCSRLNVSDFGSYPAARQNESLLSAKPAREITGRHRRVTHSVTPRCLRTRHTQPSHHHHSYHRSTPQTGPTMSSSGSKTASTDDVRHHIMSSVLARRGPDGQPEETLISYIKVYEQDEGGTGFKSRYLILVGESVVPI